MSFEWGEFLDYVKKNCTGTEDECALRIGVSRAYYAAYHCARIYLLKNKVINTGYVKHEEVWEKLKSVTDSAVRSVALNGDRLKAKRVMADYYEEPPITQTDLIIASQDADKIINKCL